MRPTPSILNGAERPVLVFTQLLRQLHEFIRLAQRETPAAEAVADEMDGLWGMLSKDQRGRTRGLSEDLYALAEGGAKAVEMSPEKTEAWRAEARRVYDSLPVDLDADAALAFLRQPHPSTLPPGAIPLLQGRCWERLGDPDTALVFYREAARLDPGHSAGVISTLLNLRRYEEAVEESNKLINDPDSEPEELFLATAPLLAAAEGKPPHEARPLYELVASTLAKAERLLSRRWSSAGAESAELRRYVVAALALSLRELGHTGKAQNVLDRAVAENPADADLMALRGSLRYEAADVKGALSDFADAARRGTIEFWPYFLLARQALKQGAWSPALAYAIRASELPAEEAARAEVYEAIAIAQAELGQPGEEVVENLARAAVLDPKNERIRQNRDLARSLLTAPAGRANLRKGLLLPDLPRTLLRRRLELGVVHRAASAADLRAGRALSTL
jgi:tetratricopeptide (TPR) repeat protein